MCVIVLLCCWRRGQCKKCGVLVYNIFKWRMRRGFANSGRSVRNNGWKLFVMNDITIISIFM